MARLEKEREALQVLFPAKEPRVPLITTTRGKAPTIRALYQAASIFEILDAMEDNRAVDWKSIDPADFYRIHAPSILGRHSDRAVAIARGEPNPATSIWERLLGTEK